MARVYDTCDTLAHTLAHATRPHVSAPPPQAMAAKLSVQKALGGMEGLADEQVISTVRHAARDAPAQHRVAACRRTLARVTLGHS